MALSVAELALARGFVRGLLDELHLTVYQFEVEPREDGWDIVVECQADRAWQVSHMNASKAMLAKAQADTNTRQALLAEFTKSLAECSRQLRGS